MKRSSIKQVALIYDAKLRYDIKVIEGVANYVRETNNWEIFIEESALNNQQLPDLRSWKGDGIIADFDDPKVASSVIASGIKAVGFGGGYGWHKSTSKIPYVYTNNPAIAKLGAEHLLQRGFRNYAFVGHHPTPINGWAEERATTFSRLIVEAGFSCEYYLGPKQVSSNWSAFRNALARWLHSLPKPVAIMGATDKRGRQILDVCRFAGIKVPEDVVVIGVDNDEMLCQLCNPPLTSVEQGARVIGYEAAALLDRLMLGKRPEKLRIVIDPIAVISRQSSDIFAVEDPRVRTALKEISLHACDRVTPTAVARIAGCARSTLELQFSNALGRSVSAEIRRVRINRAEQMVRETNRPLKQVADRCGFRSIQHMTTLFKRLFKKTPARLRRDHRASP